MPPKVIRAKSMGYCMGVQSAVSSAQRALGTQTNVYSHGLLIHNKKEISRLTEDGLKIMEDDTQLAQDATLVIRAHGIHPEERKTIKKQGINIIDATCPLVLLNQKTIQKKSHAGCIIIIAGHMNHPEMKALVGFADEVIVVENIKDVQALSVDTQRDYFLLAQTTLRPAIFDDIMIELQKKIEKLEVFNSICAATKERQQAIVNLAKEVDMIIIVGDHKSANSRGLLELAISLGIPAYLVEGPEEITDIMRDYSRVGLSAAASAPGWLIDQVEIALVQT
ncbi:MAG: 4-hydroxy-3-methylbut-2-enyl diphosphate reductase [Spirochaetia bacterium]